MTPHWIIRSEAPGDHLAVEALHFEAFGDDEGVPALVRDLRVLDAPFPSASLLAEVSGVIAGHVMLSHAWLDGPRHLIDVMVLSPLGVLPAHQGRGIGTALIAAALAAAGAQGIPMVILEGNHNFYGPRGFETAEASGIRRPSLRIPERAFQVAKLPAYDPAMTGTFVYRDVHWRHGVGLYRDA